MQFQRTIVFLPTGEGKTLIAARLIEHYLHRYPEKRAVFLVPMQSLVDQQAAVCREQIQFDDTDSPPQVLKMVGDKQAGWGVPQWKEGFEKHHIFLGTPGVFLKALVTDGYLSIAEFSVVVFDECHHAKKEAPMASIMRNSIHPHMKNSTTGLPRILGLTASFASGKTNNLEKDRKDLELLLKAEIICPDVGQKLTLSNYIKVSYNSNDQYHNQKYATLIEKNVATSLKKLGRFKDMQKSLKQCSLVFCEVGRKGIIYYLEHAVVRHIEAKIQSLELLDDENARKFAMGIKKRLPRLREEVKALGNQLSQTLSMEIDAPPRTPKLQCLLDLLIENFLKHDGGGYRGFVYVEQICLVAPIAEEINNMFLDAGASTRCGMLAGSSAQTMADRNDNLEAFRDGLVHILVSTSAGEEGLDIPQCQFAVMYSEVKTAKSHIQRSGRVRARHTRATIYYFENDPKHQVQRAEKMHLVARNSSLGSSSEELNMSDVSGCKDNAESSKYPYPSGSGQSEGGLVTLENCKDIFVQFCCTSLGESINPSEVLYNYVEVYGHQQGILTSVRYPTPESWKTVTQEEVNDYWEGEDLTKVYPLSKANGKSRAQRNERLIIFYIVRKLREEGLLDCHNKPIEKNIPPTKQACPLDESFPPRKISLKPKLTVSSLPSKTERDKMQAETLTTSISLEGSKRILQAYVDAVLGNNAVTLDDDLFDHDVLVDDESGRKRWTPMELKCPSPGGWLKISLCDYKKTFGKMDLDDQISPEVDWAWHQKLEMAFCYMAVEKLCNLGYLNEEYKPFLLPKALESARDVCSMSPSRRVEGLGSPTSVLQPAFEISCGDGTGEVSSITSRSHFNNHHDFAANAQPRNDQQLTFVSEVETKHPWTRFASNDVGVVQGIGHENNCSSTDSPQRLMGTLNTSGGGMSLASNALGSTAELDAMNSNADTKITSAVSISPEANCGRMSLASSGVDSIQEPGATIENLNTSRNESVGRLSHEAFRPHDLMSTSNYEEEDEQMRRVNSGQRSSDQDRMSDCEFMSTNDTTPTRSQNSQTIINRFGGQFDDCDDDCSGIQESQNFSHTMSDSDLMSTGGTRSLGALDFPSPPQIEGPIFNSFGSEQFDDCDEEFSI